jgi:PAS domain S-box-containing protein
MTTLVDITARVQAEEALRDSEARLRAVLDSTPFPIALVDTKDNKIDFWSRSALTLFGHTAPTAAGWYEIAYPDPDYRRDVIERWKPALEKAKRAPQAINTGEYRVACRDGSVRICELYAGFLPDNLIVTFNDVTERKRIEEALKTTMADLERSNLELEQFAYVASHDLQEPLRMVSSYTQLLAQRYKGRLDSDADDFIGYAVDGASHMQQLINDLLAYSRVGTRGNPPGPVPADQALDRALENLQAALQENAVEITRDPLPTVTIDGVQLSQVFQNLIANAIKFQGDKPPHLHITCAARGLEWVFSVRDNGIGIDPQYLERIFIIFQRLNPRGKYPGTGIGLAMCKRIILRHGGRIWAESESGKGSTFYFSLPKSGKKITAGLKPGAIP